MQIKRRNQKMDKFWNFIKNEETEETEGNAEQKHS
jgi:hypothetical protein